MRRQIANVCITWPMIGRTIQDSRPWVTRVPIVNPTERATSCLTANCFYFDVPFRVSLLLLCTNISSFVKRINLVDINVEKWKP